MPLYKNTVTKEQTPNIVFQPQTYQMMQHGINLLVNAIKPTLGPLPRYVAIERMARTQPPELLDKGAIIARRITGITNPDAEMGAMLLRQMLWQQYELYGDGTATTAILFQNLFNNGIKYIAAGGNAMRLRSYLFEALEYIQPCLAQQTTTITGRGQMKQMALMLSHDVDTAEILSEIFDTLGEYGRIDIRSGHNTILEREYIHGIYWESGVHSQEFIKDKIANKTELQRCMVFVSDLEFDDPRTLLPIITAAAHSPALVIVASKFSERAVGLLTHISKTPQRFQSIAVKIPADHAARVRMLEDIARITGARMFLDAAQEDIQHIQPQALGTVEHIWANQDYFCIVEDSDAGQRRAAYLTELYQRLQNKALNDEQRTGLRERIGRLQGAAAVLLVGGVVKSEIEDRKTKLSEIVSTLRSSLNQGIVPGGGIALLNCQSAIRQQLSSDDIDERAAYRMVSQALEMPLRHILENAGVEVGAVMGKIRNGTQGYGFDVITGQIRLMAEAGIVDSAAVVAAALDRAIRTAALALTIDVLVHRRSPDFAAKP